MDLVKEAGSANFGKMFLDWLAGWIDKAKTEKAAPEQAQPQAQPGAPTPPKLTDLRDMSIEDAWDWLPESVQRFLAQDVRPLFAPWKISAAKRMGIDLEGLRNMAAVSPIIRSMKQQGDMLTRLWRGQPLVPPEPETIEMPQRFAQGPRGGGGRQSPDTGGMPNIADMLPGGGGQIT